MKRKSPKGALKFSHADQVAALRRISKRRKARVTGRARKSAAPKKRTEVTVHITGDNSGLLKSLAECKKATDDASTSMCRSIARVCEALEMVSQAGDRAAKVLRRAK